MSLDFLLYPIRSAMTSSRVIPVLVCACLAIGCSGSSGPKLVKAGGTVTYQGRPLSGATVVFVSDKGQVATGVTDSAGKFTLQTGVSQGAVLGPGKFAITAAASGSSSSLDSVANQPKTQAEADAYMQKAAEMQKAIAEGRGKEVLPISLIPEKYSKADTSNLAFTIESDSSKNDFNIAL